MERHFAGVYWPGRVESTEACARRAATFFRLLAECDPCFSRWFEKARTLKKALELEFNPTQETFLELFARKRYREGGGHGFGAWTGDTVEGRGGTVSLTCGHDSPFYANNCLLRLPHVEPDAGRILTVPKLTEVLRAMVLAWEPEYGVVTTHAFTDTQSDNPAVDTFLGWLTYFSRQRGEVPSLPESVHVEPVEDKGTLIVLGPEPLAADNPEHLALVARVREVLAPTGLLAPV